MCCALWVLLENIFLYHRPTFCCSFIIIVQFYFFLNYFQRLHIWTVSVNLIYIPLNTILTNDRIQKDYAIACKTVVQLYQVKYQLVLFQLFRFASSTRLLSNQLFQWWGQPLRCIVSQKYTDMYCKQKKWQSQKTAIDDNCWKLPPPQPEKQIRKWL